jgi:type I restriction-modification system DNA methylase subunit
MNLNLQKMISDQQLRYIDPRSITEENRLFPLDNIKCGNSLIDDSSIDGSHFFKWEEEFLRLFESSNKPFDIVLGNPPYVNVENLNEIERDYYYKVYDVCIKRFDLYIPFINKGLNLLKNEGYLCFILSYAFLSQEYAEKMRLKLLCNSHLKCIVDLSEYKII